MTADLIIVMQGGLIEGVYDTKHPDRSIVVIDYDTEGMLPEEITHVPQGDYPADPSQQQPTAEAHVKILAPDSPHPWVKRFADKIVEEWCNVHLGTHSHHDHKMTISSPSP